MRIPAPPFWRRRGRRGRAGIVALVLVALGSLVGLGLALQGMSDAGDNAATYAKAQVCSATTGANSDCVRRQTGSVVAKLRHRSRQPDLLELTVDGAHVSVEFAAGDGFLTGVAGRDTVTVDFWHGTVAAVEDHGRRGDTLANPSVAYHQDKAVALALLAVAMLCVPPAAVSVMSNPRRLSNGRAGGVFWVVFLPLAGIVLMATAGSLADGTSDLGTVAVAGALFGVAALLGWWASRLARRAAKRRAAAGTPAWPQP